MENAGHNWDSKELMRQYNISRSTMQRLIALGMPHTKVGTRNRFSLDEVEDWYEANPTLDPFEWPDRIVLSRDTRKLRFMYRRFNAEFFRNRLPHYDVRVVKTISYDRHCSGLCDSGNKQILIHWAAAAAAISRRSVLLHEMCHVATPWWSGHGEPFLDQLRRLQRRGETWVRHDLDYLTGDGEFSKKWIQRVRQRMNQLSISNPEWTWGQAWKHLGEEFSVDPIKLSIQYPKPEGSWKQVGETLKETYRKLIAMGKEIRGFSKRVEAAKKKTSP